MGSAHTIEHVRGFGVLQTGLAFLARTIILALLSLGLTARLVIRFGPRTPLLVGLLAAAGGLLILFHAGSTTHYFPDVALSFVLIGLSAGLVFTVATGSVLGR